MAATTETICAGLLGEWPAARPGRIRVFTFAGGGRVVMLLKLTPTGGTMLVNSRQCTREGMRVGVGWALALAEMGALGWHAIYRAAV